MRVWSNQTKNYYGNLTINPVTGVGLIITTPTANVAMLVSDGTNTLSTFIASAAITFGTSSNTPFALVANGLTRMTVNPSGNITIAGPTTSGVFSLLVNSNSSSGASLGLEVNAGTNASDFCAEFNNQGDTVGYGYIRGDGSWVAGNATGGGQGLGTINAAGLFVNGVAVPAGSSGSFSGTLTGFTANPTPTCTWVKIGNMVFLTIPSGSTGTSNATSMTLTGIPAAIQPAGTNVVQITFVENSGGTANNAQAGIGTTFAAAGTMVFALQTGIGAYNASGFTASGTKGFSSETTISYSVT
jgi:hypothetical protein